MASNGSDGSGSWYNRPPRPFPAKVWLVTHYPFAISPSVFARPVLRWSSTPRPFPAKVWLAQQRRYQVQ